jgi:hypothetical protein
MDRRPAVGAVARVARDALRAGDAGDRRDEPVVAGPVDGRREPEAHGVDAPVDELEREVLGATARRVGAVERRRVVLGDRMVTAQAGDAGGQQERSPAAGQRVADGLHGRALGRVRDGRVHEVVLVGQMEHGVRFRGAGPQTVEVVEVPRRTRTPLASRTRRRRRTGRGR